MEMVGISPSEESGLKPLTGLRAEKYLPPQDRSEQSKIPQSEKKLWEKNKNPTLLVKLQWMGLPHLFSLEKNCSLKNFPFLSASTWDTSQVFKYSTYYSKNTKGLNS